MIDLSLVTSSAHTEGATSSCSCGNLDSDTCTLCVNKQHLFTWAQQCENDRYCWLTDGPMNGAVSDTFSLNDMRLLGELGAWAGSVAPTVSPTRAPCDSAPPTVWWHTRAHNILTNKMCGRTQAAYSSVLQHATSCQQQQRVNVESFQRILHAHVWWQHAFLVLTLKSS